MSDHSDTLYTFRLDLDSDREEEATLKSFRSGHAPETTVDTRTELDRQVVTLVEKIPALDGSVADPAGHAGHVAGRLFPTMLSFELGSRAAFRFNGRALHDDALDVTRLLLTGAPLGDEAAEQEGAAPSRAAPHPA